MLHATAHGLFEMDWLLICPRCACAVESFARLRAVLRHFRCPECHNEYEAAMDDFIAIYFNVSPQICAIRYQRPETLDPFDYMFQFRGVREGHRPNGQPYIDSVRDALRGHRLPGTRRDRHLRVRGSAGRCSPASARTPMPASRCRSGPSAAPSRNGCA